MDSEDLHRAALLDALARLPARLGIPTRAKPQTVGPWAVVRWKRRRVAICATREPADACDPAPLPAFDPDEAIRDLLVIRLDAAAPDGVLAITVVIGHESGAVPECSVTLALDDAGSLWLLERNGGLGLMLTKTGLIVRLNTPFWDDALRARASTAARALLVAHFAAPSA